MLWFSQILVMAGYDAMNPFIPLFMKNELGLTDPVQLSKFVALYNIASFIAYGVANPLWGWVGDKYGIKPMLIRGTFLTSIFWPMMAYSPSPWILVIYRGITAFLAGTTAASYMMIARTTPLERQGFAQGTLTTAVWGGSMLGNVVGGLVIHFYHYTHAFWICGIVYFLAGIFIFFTHDDASKSIAKVATEPQNKRPWWKFSTSSLSAQVWSIIALFVLLGVIRRIEQPYTSLRIEQMSGADMADYWTGIVSAFVGIGAILSGVIFGRLIDAYPAKKLMLPVIVGTAFFVLLQGIGQSLLFFSIARTLSYFVAGAIQPMLQKRLSAETPREHRGIAFGLSTTGVSIGGTVAAIMGAFFFRHFGAQGVFIGTAVVTVVSVPLFRMGFRR